MTTIKHFYSYAYSYFATILEHIYGGFTFYCSIVSAIFFVFVDSSWMQGSNCIGMFVVDLRTVQMVGYLCRGGWKKKIVFVVNL